MRVQSYLRGRTWWVRYRLDGRQVRRSLETQNRKIAEDLAVELEWQLLRGQQPTERRRTSIASARRERCRRRPPPGSPCGDP